MSQSDQWTPELYDNKHSFVWELAQPVLGLLEPTDGELIVDLGCGTGHLTSKIADRGAKVIGIDSSAAMIAQAQSQFPDLDFRIADAHDFQLEQKVDAFFSNAALHWITRPSKVVQCIAACLKPGGRLVVEFGGKGNVAFLSQAIRQASREFGSDLKPPWYFPSIAEFGSLLEMHGLELTQARLIDRPTPLEGEDGLRNWVAMFGQHWLSGIPADCHEQFFAAVEKIARPNLYHNSVWIADYRRIRIVAVKTKSLRRFV